MHLIKLACSSHCSVSVTDRDKHADRSLRSIFDAFNSLDPDGKGHPLRGVCLPSENALLASEAVSLPQVPSEFRLESNADLGCFANLKFRFTY